MTRQEEMFQELVSMAQHFKYVNTPVSSKRFVQDILNYQASQGAVIALKGIPEEVEWCGKKYIKYMTVPIIKRKGK